MSGKHSREEHVIGLVLGFLVLVLMFCFVLFGLLKKIGKTHWIGAWTITLGFSLWRTTAKRNSLTDKFLWPSVLAFLRHVSYSHNQLTTPWLVAPSHPILTWNVLLETRTTERTFEYRHWRPNWQFFFFLTSVGYSTSLGWQTDCGFMGPPKVSE